MSRSKTLFFVALWLIAFAPIAMLWGMYPLSYVHRHTPTMEEVRKEFPWHIAQLPPSEIQQHLTRLETEDEETKMEFSATDWALRETRYRLIILFVLWMAAGFFIHWFAGLIIQGKRSLEE